VQLTREAKVDVVLRGEQRRFALPVRVIKLPRKVLRREAPESHVAAVHEVGEIVALPGKSMQAHEVAQPEANPNRAHAVLAGHMGVDAAVPEALQEAGNSAIYLRRPVRSLHSHLLVDMPPEMPAASEWLSLAPPPVHLLAQTIACLQNLIAGMERHGGCWLTRVGDDALTRIASRRAWDGGGLLPFSSRVTSQGRDSERTTLPQSLAPTRLGGRGCQLSSDSRSELTRGGTSSCPRRGVQREAGGGAGAGLTQAPREG